DKPHCITSFFYFYLVASIHQLAGYELYTLSLSILSHNESLIGHMLCIINMCDINTSLINLSRRVYRCQWINGYYRLFSGGGNCPCFINSLLNLIRTFVIFDELDVMDGILALTFFASPPTVLTFFFTVTVAFSTFLACEPLLKTRSVTALYTSLFLTSFHTKVGNRYSSILKRCIHIIYIAFHRCYIFRYRI